MKTVNSLSGGKTSSYIAVKYPADYEVFSLVCIDDHLSKPKDKSIIDYINGKLEKYTPEYGEFIATAEDDKTLYAMRDLEQFIGREITWVRGMSFDQVIDSGTKTRLPSWARRYCTEKMKLLPIFLWWFNTIGEKCQMRIGFRFDEFDRMERFFNNSNPTNFSIPISCKNYGLKRQVFQDFNWRYCHLPLVKNGIKKQDVTDYWEKFGYVGGNLFEPRRKIEFPVISNCVGCFHKNEETLAVMAELNFSKMKWFANQEMKDMGTWLDSRVTYQHLIDNRKSIAQELLYEIEILEQSCDSGGCTA
jgi:hypothetical protein